MCCPNAYKFNKVETYFSEGLYPHKDKMNIKTFFHLPGSKLSGKRHCSATFGQTGCVTPLVILKSA